METTLYEAALEGNVTTLLQLLQQDTLILDRVIINGLSDSPLHVAAMLGHVDFVEEILCRKPELAKELDPRLFSPLHIASQKGYVDIVKALLQVNPDVCLSRDLEGRNPLHLAAMKGRIAVLGELLRARPLAAYATTIWGETILHLFVKHNQFEALKFLLPNMDPSADFLNAKDDYGMTVLHLAVAEKQIATINFLLMNTRVEVNALNTNGYTALDILAQSRRDMKDLDIAETLRGVGAFKAIEIDSSEHRNIGALRIREIPSVSHERISLPHPSGHHNLPKPIKKDDWLTRKRDALMVVASLIATMAFQAGLTPPGGLWQDDSAGGSQDNNTTGSHKAGESITAYNNTDYYSRYLISNTAGLIASLSIILLLITGLPYQRRFFMWLLTVIVWIAIISMAITYRLSISVFTPKQAERTVNTVIKYAVEVWCVVMGLLLLIHTIHLAQNLFKKIENLVGKRRRPSPLLNLNNTHF